MKKINNFTKQCEQAEEIQREWKHNKKDNYVKNTQGLRLLTWLPTQEQLQEMLKEKWIYYGGYPLSKFCNWILTSGGNNVFYYHEYKDQFKSINELWLAFVMYEKFNKMWNGERWTNENNKKKRIKRIG